jgi:hypothetical protein
MRRHYNLILMVLWAVVGVCLIAPEVLPEKVQQQVRAPGGPLAGALALMFAAYNLVRWWALQSLYRNRRMASVNPLAARHDDRDREENWEPNPDLDFSKLPDAEQPTPPPKPSANGDHK